MKDLKKIDIQVSGNFAYSDTITISVDGKKAEYNPTEILGVVAKLSELQNELTHALIIAKMKELGD